MATIIKPEPVDSEVIWDKTKVIISETDSFGTITNVNNVFLEVSGYTMAELIGQPHNVVRHPDMPKIIFKILWDNLKKGNNFIGIIKNLAKSGCYYWVIMDFEIRRNVAGEITHYIGRRKAVPDSVVSDHIGPFYETLVKLEQVGGIGLSSRYFKNYLAKINKDYVDFIITIMSEAKGWSSLVDTSCPPTDNVNSIVIPDSIHHLDNQNDEKRKSFFDRLFL